MSERHQTGVQNIFDEIQHISSIDSNRILEIIAGFEAKILIDGSIDCPEKYADKYYS